MQDLQVQGENKIYFEVKEGSNYKITTSYKAEYIVEFGLFQKVVKAIFNAEQDFITVNDTIINKKYIYLIEPTKELTDSEYKVREKKKFEDEQEREKVWRERPTATGKYEQSNGLKKVKEGLYEKMKWRLD